MGADLTLEYLPCADTKKDGRREEFSSLVEHLSADDLTFPVFDSISVEEARKVLLGYFDRFEDIKDMRDATIICPYRDKPPLVITGGLSWGDYATESAEPIAWLSEAPGVYELFEEWALEDANN